MSSSYQFPQGFIWGTATAAHQIEGAFDAEGRGASVWDAFTTRTGDTAAIANDHYHRYEADLDLMASLGIRHYRLSIAWSRIIPTGRGQVNEAGLAFYERLIDAALARGITPYVTLYHWDHPQALETRYGGFRSREMADDLADYAAVVVRRLGDRVTNWFTMNEIGCCTWLSYPVGEPSFDNHAPRVRLANAKAVNQTIHHATLAHGKMVQAIRAHSPRPCKVALVDNPIVSVPLTESDADIAAARMAFQTNWTNGQILYPVLTGRWSPRWESQAAASGELPEVMDGDFATISQPLDAMGLNIYSGLYHRASENVSGTEQVPFTPNYPRLAMPWLQLMPESLYWSQRFIRESCGYLGDLYITENGCAVDDWLTPQGEVLDVDRIHYLRQYLRQLHRGIVEGFPTKGYFLWSFMDNFEWTWGYSKRFGIVWNSFDSQTRIPKASAHWYAETIRQNRVV